MQQVVIPRPLVAIQITNPKTQRKEYVFVDQAAKVGAMDIKMEFVTGEGDETEIKTVRGSFIECSGVPGFPALESPETVVAKILAGARAAMLDGAYTAVVGDIPTELVRALTGEGCASEDGQPGDDPGSQ